MADHIVVETVSGKLRGIVQNGVRIFKGIPYGGPVEGAGRFMPPAKPAPWTGVRDALDFGPRAMQPDQPFGISPEVLALLSLNDPQPMSENCLVLNVWTPAARDGGKRPVMFWCHGGAFTAGSGSSDWYDGANLSRKGDAVVVTVNHRLGVLGYLHLGDLGGDAYAASGNAGMLDLVAALTWVRDNIAGFGGDPANVTIFGESGGGAKVSVLMAMPAAHGLFHKAIVQSGAGVQMTPRENATETAKAVLANLGLDTREIDKLRTLPAVRLIEAQSAVSSRMSLAAVANRRRVGFNPVVDGRILPANPFEPAAPEFSANVPVIVGTNKDEMNLFFGLDRHLDTLEEAGMREMVKSIVGDSTDRFIEIYRRSRPNAAPKDVLLAIATDRTMRIDSIKLAERKAAQNAAPVYMYMFAWETPVLGGRLKAPHALEIPFVFDTLAVSAIAGDGPERFPLADRMSKAWLAFARIGDPNHAGLPKWSAYSIIERATMIFDNECKVEHDPHREERLAWTGA